MASHSVVAAPTTNPLQSRPVCLHPKPHLFLPNTPAAADVAAALTSDDLRRKSNSYTEFAVPSNATYPYNRPEVQKAGFFLRERKLFMRCVCVVAPLLSTDVFAAILAGTQAPPPTIDDEKSIDSDTGDSIAFI